MGIRGHVFAWPLLGAAVGLVAALGWQHTGYDRQCPGAFYADDVCHYTRHVTALGLVTGAMIGGVVGLAAMLVVRWLDR